MRNFRSLGSLILILAISFSMLFSNIPTAKATNKVYYSIDYTESVLASRIPQTVSGGCSVASMATIEAYMFGAVSDTDKELVYNLLVETNSDDNYAYWGNVGYKTSQDSIDWEAVYDQLALGYPCIIHRPASGSQSQHWSVVAGYQGSSSQLEPDQFLVVEVNEKSGAPIQTVKEWRGDVAVDRYTWRADGLGITELPGIHFAVDHPPVIKEYGVAHRVYGQITSDSNLTDLQIRVIRTDTQEVKFSVDLNPNSKTYAMSALDSKMTYTSWPEGTYYFTIYAKNAEGLEDMYGVYFEIRSAYPQEIPDPVYTFSFDANGGTGTMEPVTAQFGESLTLPANSITRDGASFGGWNVKRSDGTWLTTARLWLSESEISAGGYTKAVIPDGYSGTMDAWWIRDAMVIPNYTFVAHWPEYEEDTPTESQVYRISGNTRYETAFSVANAMKEYLELDYFQAVIIASGTEFADALAGSYLAAVKVAPILLTDGNNAAALNQYLDSNLTPGGTVYILGGPAAIPQTLQEELETGNRTVIRLYGSDRYATNLAILEEAGVGDQEILVTTGRNYADSVSASAVGLPILLVNPGTNELSIDQIVFLQSLNANDLTIIGGPDAVSGEIEAHLKRYGEVDREYGEVRRIYGATREETSAAVAQRYFPNSTTVCISYSRNFPDALCGGPLAAFIGIPLLTVSSGAETAAAAYCAEHNVTAGIVLGGTTALPDSVARTVFSLSDRIPIQIY